MLSIVCCDVRSNAHACKLANAIRPKHMLANACELVHAYTLAMNDQGFSMSADSRATYWRITRATTEYNVILERRAAAREHH